jgi:membrane protease YdiL (CAAX protease family)
MSSDRPALDSSLYNRPGAGIGARAKWGLGDIGIGVVMAISTFFLVLGGIVAPVASGYGDKSPEALFAQAIAVMLWDGCLVLIVYWRARKHGCSWADLGLRGPWQDGSWTLGRLAGTVLAAYVASLTCVFVYSIIINITGLDDLLPGQQIPEEFFQRAWLVALIGVSVVVTAPIAEELFFRGFIYAGLRRRLPIPLAALSSGLLFSIAHGQPGLIIPFTFVGAILAYTYERTGTLRANMTVHFIFNFVSFVILVAVPSARS